MAFRVPVPDVSVVDLTVRLNKAVSYSNKLWIINENNAKIKAINEF